MAAATSAGMDADHREEMSAAGLSLGLIYGIDKSDHSAGKILQLERCASTDTSIEPALTLGLPGDRQESEKDGTTADGGNACPTSRGPDLGRRPSSSDHRLSRVRTETSGKALPSGGSDGEEDGRTRKKLRLSKEQSALLEDKFKEQTTLTTKQKQTLARQLKLRPRQVEVWFQNRRARTKLKKTEAECELLRKFCNGLREENKRLQKELQALNSLKFASASRYMQTPLSAAAICSSCKNLSSRAGGSGGGGDDEQGGSFPGYSAQPRFLNSFAHQSGAEQDSNCIDVNIV